VIGSQRQTWEQIRLTSLHKMKTERRLFPFLTQGLHHGASAGCVSSLAFICLVIILFGIVTESFIDESFGSYLSLAGFVAFVYGFIPAMVIACLFGLISGLAYYLLQGQLSTRKRSLILSLILSLGVALPAIVFWLSFFFSGFQIEQVRFNGFSFFHLLIAIFCVGAGLYIGTKLHNMIMNDGDIVNE
jgi:hypothetical protein